ncbi:OBERON 1-like protein [Drosera capensis]
MNVKQASEHLQRFPFAPSTAASELSKHLISAAGELRQPLIHGASHLREGANQLILISKPETPFWLLQSNSLFAASMTREADEEPMDFDDLDATNGHSFNIRKNGLVSGRCYLGRQAKVFPMHPWIGLDKVMYGWRVGKRTGASGYYMDRYLYPPVRLRKSERVKGGFASKLQAKHYIRTKFPDADIDALFASFSWKISSKHVFMPKDHVEEHVSFSLSSEDTEEQSLSDAQSVALVCEAGNRHCRSLMDEVKLSPVALMPCDICFSEPNFCRDCCCILCCKTVKLNLGGYSFIRCGVCGHVAHVNCALRSYMAGRVGGSIGLDAEYYCRRCDSRTDLVKHVSKIIRTCKSIEAEENAQKMLKLGVFMLRGTQKEGTRRVLNRVELALQKAFHLVLHRGSELKDIWKLEEDPSSGMTGDEVHPPDSGVGVHNGVPAGTTIMDCEIEYLRVEKEIDQVLHDLRKSQEYEYGIVQERLHAQKDYIFSLCEQLEQHKSELERQPTRRDELLSAIADKNK